MSEKRKCVFYWFLSLVVLSLALPTPLQTQDLAKKVKDLEQKIVQLETRIARLEGIILALQKKQEKPLLGSADRWKDKTTWRLLKKGMSKDEVRQVLGEPPKIVPNVYYGDIWYYPDAQGGNASFDKEGLLTSWSEF